MIKGISHTAFVTKDMKKTLHFYIDILGFKQLYELKDKNNNPWLICLKISDRQFLELFYGGIVENTFTHKRIGSDHICFEVDDIYEIAERLKKNCLVLDSKPSQGKDLNLQCWAKDPDGNRIEFMQMDPNSLQALS
jgi:catechol 2,3-dioxygenase-like lactoylglutathione lyase family enzyme